MALGALDRSAGLAAACGAEVVVIHPGFWLGRDREQTLDDVVRWLETLRERLEQKDRAVPFGVEVMGRVSELGSIDDTLHIAERVPWVRPVIDFAHMHATSDGAFTDTEAFAVVLERADAVLEPGAPFHIHFSDIAYANRNETKHLPYGDGTLRAEPLRDALARFDRPATVISESPDEASTQAIKATLGSRSAASSRLRRLRPTLLLALHRRDVGVERAAAHVDAVRNVEVVDVIGELLGVVSLGVLRSFLGHRVLLRRQPGQIGETSSGASHARTFESRREVRPA